MGAALNGRASAFPTALIGQAVRMLSRCELEALTERLIERLDEIDGDPDLEPEFDRGIEDDPQDVEAGSLTEPDYEIDQREGFAWWDFQRGFKVSWHID